MKGERYNFHDNDAVHTKSSKQATTTCYYFPQSTNKPRIHQSCVNQPTNKQTTKNKVLLVSWPAKFTPHFMNLEGSLPCSQMPSTCPCPVPYSSSPHPIILIPSLRSTLILPSHLYLQVLPHQNPLHISVFCRTCHMPHPTHPPTFIIPIIIWLVETSLPVTSSPLGPSIFLSTLSLNILSLCSPLIFETQHSYWCKTDKIKLPYALKCYASSVRQMNILILTCCR